MPGGKIVAILIIATACVTCGTRHKGEISGIDWDAWKADRNGCQMTRETYIDTLAAQTDLLKTMSEMEIVELMGRPDETELLERNQKFFTYFLEGGPGCASTDGGSMWLIVRFNAVGLAKEVMIEGEVTGE
jgi:hypothetical protein